jgi:ferric-dicitrate binding protein FerR (iron transport regulator)
LQIPDFFRDLFQKYLDNECSAEETAQLLSLLKKEGYKDFAIELIGQQVSKRQHVRHVDFALEERLEKRLQDILQQETPVVQMPGNKIKLFTHRTVAAAIIALVLGVSVLFFLLPAKPVDQPVAGIEGQSKPTATYIRHLTLPDGSSVVLHAGSRLAYPPTFEGKYREVTLHGEAYFDIAHNASSPFIIHTGKVKTTVLGTAFNIKADAKHVVVSVTRGKVKVEDDSKILAVLSPDQQVQYDVPESKAAQQTVNANALVTDWTRQDMVFNGITFGEIATLLSKRYGVPVVFKNDLLKNCKIRASFSGTETIEQVASVLCAIRNGNFQSLPDGTIELNGEGCD